MANEATVQASLTIQKRDSNNNLLMNERISISFQADVNGTFGPHPGCLTVSQYGTDIDLSKFTTPALAVFTNMDDTNYCSYGIRDPENDFYFPLGEIGPAEGYVLRLSRELQEEFVGTGTGTASPADTNKLHFKGRNADIPVQIKIFEA